MPRVRMLYWKPGVNPRDLQLVMRQAILICDEVYREFKKKLTVTCTGDGSHSISSLHPWGFAIDIRTRIFTEKQKTRAFLILEKRFKDSLFQIIWHTTHFHIEYDPSDWKKGW